LIIPIGSARWSVAVLPIVERWHISPKRDRTDRRFVALHRLSIGALMFLVAT
jgi:hypothetical protein